MKIYLVGGAVRDQLLGFPVKERDWVVVGATPEQLLKLGYKPVGKDFPVFLHPQTHEEYALARTERKTGKGYKGFKFYANPNVTLEEDLQRRDLTINAMAQAESGEIIDPYGGQQDLRNRLLRHVSPAFAEDPVRILRVARFAARFPDFRLHPDTLMLMQQMVNDGEADALVAERVWQECVRGLAEKSPQRFFILLNEANALKKLFPEINLTNMLPDLMQASKKTVDQQIRFAAMLVKNSLTEINSLCQRLRVPTEFRDLAILLAQFNSAIDQAQHASASELNQILEKTDALRRPERFCKLLDAYLAIHTDLSAQNNCQRLQQALKAIQAIKMEKLDLNGLNGKAIAEKIRRERIKALEQLNNPYP